jgi:hypothetical protein
MSGDTNISGLVAQPVPASSISDQVARLTKYRSPRAKFLYACAVVGLVAFIYLKRRRAAKAELAPKARSEAKEHYGPPPGKARALSHNELGDRGWAEWPREYEANSASSISHMMLRG